MPWTDYHNAAQAEIEATEDRVEETWDEAWALLLLLSSRLRATLVRAALGVDLDDRRSVIRFRSLTAREVKRFEAAAERAILGRSTDAILNPTGPSGPARGIQGASIRATHESTTARWSTMRKWAAKDSEDAIRKRLRERGYDVPDDAGASDVRERVRKALPGPNKTKGDPFGDWLREEERAEGIQPGSTGGPAFTDEELRQMEQDAQDWALLTSEGEGGQFVRELEFHLRSGRDDMLGEAAMNPRRNIRYEADRLTESTIGLTSKNAKRGSARDVVEYLVGVQGDARKTRAANSRRGGWRLNENNMRLSVVAHIRAMHRRAMVTLARAHGITHFMMSIPARRRGRIAPTGACGQQLWRVRTWDEWLAVQTRANAGRIASSAFDSLGLGYGDCTYLVPVPAVYLDQARAYGERMRDKWMATDTKPATRRTALRRAA